MKRVGDTLASETLIDKGAISGALSTPTDGDALAVLIARLRAHTPVSVAAMAVRVSCI